MTVTLTLTDKQKSDLHHHLFPGDGNEAVAIMLCAKRAGTLRHRLLVRKIVFIPYGSCLVRAPDRVCWSTDLLPALLDEASREDWSVMKIHGHSNEFRTFSRTDDASDAIWFPSVAGWVGSDFPCGSVVMLEDGRLFGRVATSDGAFCPLDNVMVIGDDVKIDFHDSPDVSIPDGFMNRHARAFGGATTALLRRLGIAVIGCSGTGSPVTEQLLRLGVGRMVLADPDVVKEENLNRILHATNEDIGRFKVDVTGDAIKRAGLGTEVVRLREHVSSRKVVEQIAECDFIFGCMDGAEGRNVISRLSTCYLLPYIDVGVKILAAGDGTIDEVSAAVHYLQPGCSTLSSRGVFTSEDVRADSLRRTNPDEYERRRRARYVVGVEETKPAVISVNFMAAAMAVNEFLARLHDYRTEGNKPYAEWRVSLSHVQFYPEREKLTSAPLRDYVGAGDIEPRLDMPELS